MKEKETIRRFIVNERASCDSHTKFSGTVPLENWRTCVAVHTLKRGWHSPRRKKIWFRESTTFTIVTNKYKWSSSTNKIETIKGQAERKSSKLIETVRSSKVSLEKIPIDQIKDTSNWHMRYWRVFVQESPNSFPRQLQGAISRECRTK